MRSWIASLGRGDGGILDKKTVFVCVVSLSVVAALAAPGARAAGPSPQLERGRYLLAIGGCHDCHTPMKMGPKGPEPDMTRALSGHPAELKLPPAPKPSGPWIWSGAATNTAFAGPWGISYAANLTPDPDTGIGIWKEDTFVKAMRLGKHWGQPAARDIMPPMPWQAYKNMTDEDLKALFAALMAGKAIKNMVPEYQPPAAPPAK